MTLYMSWRTRWFSFFILTFLAFRLWLQSTAKANLSIPKDILVSDMFTNSSGFLMQSHDGRKPKSKIHSIVPMSATILMDLECRWRQMAFHWKELNSGECLLRILAHYCEHSNCNNTTPIVECSTRTKKHHTIYIGFSSPSPHFRIYRIILHLHHALNNTLFNLLYCQIATPRLP